MIITEIEANLHEACIEFEYHLSAELNNIGNIEHHRRMTDIFYNEMAMYQNMMQERGFY